MLTIQVSLMYLAKPVCLQKWLNSLFQFQVLLNSLPCMSTFNSIQLLKSILVLNVYIFDIEIDDDDSNDILNYSGTTKSYSVPSENDTDDTVDYRNQDDEEGNSIMKHFLK